MSAPAQPESAQLLERCAAGDPLAEAALFERYVHRLTWLARARLSQRLAARVDPEDIVLSAYRSFFVGARQRQFALHASGDLWRLLVKITLAKVYDRANEHRAAKRNVTRELIQVTTDYQEAWRTLLARDPAPDEVGLAIETLEQLLAALPPLGAQVIELRLQGYRQDEIAKRLGCAERTVRRWLRRAQELLGGNSSE